MSSTSPGVGLPGVEEQRAVERVEELDAADRDRADRVAVVAVAQADEAGALGARPLVLPPLEGHLQRDLDGGRAAVGVEDAREARRARGRPAAWPARSPAGGSGRASSSARRGRAGRGSRRRCAGGGGRGRCTTARRRRRCRRGPRCRRASCPAARSTTIGGSSAQPALLGERMPEDLAVQRDELVGGHGPEASPAPGRNRRAMIGARCAGRPLPSSSWSSSSARRASARRSPPRACSRRGSAPRRSCGRTRSRSCSSRCRPATGSAGGWPTASPTPGRARRASCSPPGLLLARRALRGRAVPARLGRRAGLDLGRRVRRLAGRRCSCSWRCRCCCWAPSRRTRSGSRVRTRRGVGLGRRPAVRDLDLRLAGRRVRRGARADPARRHAAHVPGLRARAGARRRARRCGGASSPRRRRSPLLLALPVGTIKAAERGARARGGRHRVPVRARGRSCPTASGGSSSTRAQAVHSVWRPGTFLTGDYWDGFLVLPFAGRAAPPRRIAILGNAGGTTARALRPLLPAARRSTRWRSTAS